MTFDRRLLSVSLLALAVIPVGAHGAAAKSAAIPCYKADGQTWEYLVKPKTCAVYDNSAQEIVPFTLKGLKWETWGKKSATARGKINESAYSGPIDVKAQGLKVCTPTLSIYTKYAVSIPKRGNVAVFSSLPCPTS